MPTDFMRLFRQDMPDREEERMLSLILAIASRLHTGVRLADEAGPADSSHHA